ncbi:hypothetical protein FQN49_008624 [Arthroderma sp. PD_2]|nr:hypothetical protein FQN49_008624 [Arthroderma sp. PD_2]
MGFSLHMADFSGEDLITQYREEPKMLCDSKPRQQFHKSINELQCPPVFKRFPKLDPDTGLEDPKEVLVEGVTACKPVIGEAVGRKEMDKLRKVERNRTVGIRPTYGVKRNRIMGRRENTKAQRPFGCEFKHAVVVNKGYTAKHLCEDPNSAGADYGNREEGLFCDMCSKKLWSFCSAKVTSNCFDEGERAIRGQNSGLKRDNTGTPMHKRYVAVQAWDD